MINNTKIKRCPITFIEDDINHDNDELNNIFIMPYEMGMVSAIQHAMIEDDFRKKLFLKSDNERDITYHAYNAHRNDVGVLTTNITSYLVMNVRELVYSTLVTYVDRCFAPSKKQELINLINVSELSDLVKNSVVGSLDVVYSLISSDFDSNIAYKEFEQAMEYVFSQIVALVFDKYVLDIIEYANRIGEFDALYGSLFVECYGEDTPIKGIGNVSIMYSFVSACLREKMQNFVIDFRRALTYVSGTCVAMMIGAPIYDVDNYMDKNYTAVNLINSNPELKPIAPLLLAEIEEGKEDE